MPVETEYYDILEVTPEATDTELKKAYRKLAIKFHPDKNSSSDAETKFKEVGEAYQILSDPDLRANYDKYGKKQLGQPDGGMQDPSELFGSLFGGERFMDLIGEISLIKDFMGQAEVMMSSEERAQMEAEMSGGAAPKPAASTSAADTATSADTTTTHPSTETTEPTPTFVPTSNPAAPSNNIPSPATQSLQHHLSSSSGSPAAPSSTSAAATGTSTPPTGDSFKKSKKPTVTPEQQKKLAEMEEAKEKARVERVELLQKKLIDRIRPFVNAKKPGDKDDEETRKFIESMRTEAEDLKLESFGVELLHTIGNIYTTKATTFLKSKRFFGGGFFSRIKEKGSLVKEGWGVLGSAMDVQAAMEEMEKQQENQTLGEEELEALAKDVTSKILLTTWRGTKFEVIQVLSEVLDGVLTKKSGVSDETLIIRAKAIITVGAVFKATEPDESDEERRELERLVAQAALPSKKRKEAEKKEARLHAEKACPSKSTGPATSTYTPSTSSTSGFASSTYTATVTSTAEGSSTTTLDAQVEREKEKIKEERRRTGGFGFWGKKSASHSESGDKEAKL